MTLETVGADLATEGRLLALEQHVAALEARIGVLEPLSDEAFVKAIATSVQGRVFTTIELRRHARVDPELKRAIRGFSNQQLGIKLGQLAGRNIGGLVVQRVGRDDAGTLWAVAVADLHSDAGIAPM